MGEDVDTADIGDIAGNTLTSLALVQALRSRYYSPSLYLSWYPMSEC